MDAAVVVALLGIALLLGELLLSTGGVLAALGALGLVAGGILALDSNSSAADYVGPALIALGVLSLVAESTAWATQIRMLVPQLHRRLDDVVGRGVVTRVEVRGPTGPDWRKGPLRVRGPGPRDTYG